MGSNCNNFDEVLQAIAGDYDDNERDFSVVFVPDPNVDDNVLTDEDEYNDSDNEQGENDVFDGSYEVIFNNYTPSQQLLEENHSYKWVQGEATHHSDLETKIFLTDEQKNSINSMSPSEIFELFFSKEIKNLIITASKENELDISIAKLENFIGILLVSIINTRKDTRDY